MHLDVLRPWVTKKVTTYVGYEDDILINMVMAELEKVRRARPSPVTSPAHTAAAPSSPPRKTARADLPPLRRLVPDGVCVCPCAWSSAQGSAEVSRLIERRAYVHARVRAHFLARLCAQEDEPDPRRVQVNLTGFLERNTGAFMGELWDLCISAQQNFRIADGVWAGGRMAGGQCVSLSGFVCADARTHAHTHTHTRTHARAHALTHAHSLTAHTRAHTRARRETYKRNAVAARQGKGRRDRAH